MEQVEQLILDIFRGIVEYPDDVKIFMNEDVDEFGDILLIKVRVHRYDVGMCIGKKGAHAEAIRKVVGLVSFKQTGRRTYVKVDAPKLSREEYGSN